MERDLVVLSFSTPNLSCESRYALLATDKVLVPSGSKRKFQK